MNDDFTISDNKNGQLTCKCGQVMKAEPTLAFEMGTETFYLAFKFRGQLCPKCGNPVLDRSTRKESLGDI